MRTSPQQDRVQKTIDHIVETAEKLFVDPGYERVSTNLIAKEAGISIGSLYRYFKNKEALLEYLMKKYNPVFVEALKAEMSVSTFQELHDSFFNIMEKTFSKYPILMELVFSDVETLKMKKLDKRCVETINHIQADKYQKINPKLSRGKAIFIANIVHMTIHHLLVEAKKASKNKKSFDP